MRDAEYTNREVDAKFDSVESVSTANTQTLITEMRLGFKGVHDRQDIANHRTEKLETATHATDEAFKVFRARVTTAIIVLSTIVGSVFIPLAAAAIQAGKL